MSTDVSGVAELVAEQHLQLLQILVHLLPAANVLLLKHLLSLLKRVCEQKETRMTAAALGRLFAPHLLIPRKVGSSFCQCDLSCKIFFSFRFSFCFHSS